MAVEKKLTGDNRIDFGWFSRRHQTSADHEANYKMWQDERSPDALKTQAEARQAERVSRTPQEQIALLDKRLGADIGAKRERARLEAEIKAMAS